MLGFGNKMKINILIFPVVDWGLKDAFTQTWKCIRAKLEGLNKKGCARRLKKVAHTLTTPEPTSNIH